jgi:Phosphatidylserine decarboxylase
MARSFTQWIKSQPLYDRLYALYENSRWSTREIEPFIRKYHIDMAEFEPVRYRSFAEFFDRRFRPGVRKFPSAPGEMSAFAEARYFGWKRVEPDQTFPVKGRSLSVDQILGSSERARPFVGGPVSAITREAARAAEDLKKSRLHGRAATAARPSALAVRQRANSWTPDSGSDRPVALDRHTAAGTDLGVIIPQRHVLNAAIVPERDRVRPPAKPHLEFRPSAVFE